MAAPEANPAESPPKKIHLACNAYSWHTFYRREDRDFYKPVSAGLVAVAEAGYDGYEPGLADHRDIDRIASPLKKHGLQIRSAYVNSTLHNPEQIAKSVENVLASAEKAKRLGTKIIVTNPNPIDWNKPEDKDDEQLKTQAKALNDLGAKLKSMDLTLAYHTHDMEMRCAARELHHMLLATDPENVTFCLDAHWVYRGSGNSSVALFDILKLYGKRISELHLRQSVNGVWSETFADGDIDYRAVAKYLLDIGVRPHLVMEQACEDGTPKTLSASEALAKSAEYARKVFADFAK